MPEEICPVCGLPKSLCVCGVIDREMQKIKVFTEARRFGKVMTIVEGITDRGREVSKELKSKLACGGTYKNNLIELQGNHKGKIKNILVKLGFSENQIEVS
jgi:translation initiation factor 1